MITTTSPKSRKHECTGQSGDNSQQHVSPSFGKWGIGLGGKDVRKDVEWERVALKGGNGEK